jgi:tRNA nucleotidyltransferase (CCA-adding enzyme)
MQVYLVGGAVRDQLLGREVQERDWVVLGATPAQMLQQGYQQVGKDFPVFLHPETKEEYALARTERKNGRGYYGFTCDASPDVTLEQDLQRRDLTINAMAQSADGQLIDPFHGQDDIQHKVLRHVSSAFVEDPLRLLRVARFMARFAHLGFSIAPATLSLLQQLVTDNELEHLVAERIWKELSRALAEPNPQAFIQTLRQVGALKSLLPEVEQLYGVEQVKKWHPEVDTGLHIELCLAQAALLTPDPMVRFAVLCHDLGKGITPLEILPHHYGHEMRGVKLVHQLCDRLKVPNEFRELAAMTAQYHGHCHKVQSLKASTLLKTLEALDALRRPQRFQQFLLACTADARGRYGSEQAPYLQAAYFQQALDIVSKVDTRPIVENKNLVGPAIKQAIYAARVRALKEQLVISP